MSTKRVVLERSGGRTRSVIGAVHAVYRRLGFRFVEPNPPGPTKRMRAVEREVRIPLYDEGRRKTLTNAECSADER